MADEPTETGYVVLHEVTLADLQGDIVLEKGTRLFVTDGSIVPAGGADQAIRAVIEGHEATANLDGVWATCPARSWNPEEWEISVKPVARKKRSSTA